MAITTAHLLLTPEKVLSMTPLKSASSHIAGITAIINHDISSGMEVVVNSIQYGGSIIPVELLVYDLNGQRGIAVPDSEEINAMREVASTLAQSAGTSITISDDAGSQLAADMGKGLIQGASQYVSKKMGIVRVTVKANYGLLLLPETN